MISRKKTGPKHKKLHMICWISFSTPLWFSYAVTKSNSLLWIHGRMNCSCWLANFFPAALSTLALISWHTSEELHPRIGGGTIPLSNHRFLLLIASRLFAGLLFFPSLPRMLQVSSFTISFCCSSDLIDQWKQQIAVNKIGKGHVVLLKIGAVACCQVQAYG